MSQPSRMYTEVREIPAVVHRLLDEGRDAIREAAGLLQTAEPVQLITFARGSSDHAATYLKYACELIHGIPVASVGPSLASVYENELKLRHSACLAISQSGQSPDIVRAVSAAKNQGALTIALTNQSDSPLSAAAGELVPLLAGPEHSVPATKTYVASLVAGLAVLAHWRGDDDLLRAIDGLPDALDRALECDWAALRSAMTQTSSAFVLGRGISLGTAQEAALKLKETCQVHAEAYSAAEVLHGPVAIVGRGFPVLAMVTDDATSPGFTAVCDQLAGMGATVVSTSLRSKHTATLDVIATGHVLTDPISMIVSFYKSVEILARELGKNPDLPQNLMKVTETL